MVVAMEHLVVAVVSQKHTAMVTALAFFKVDDQATGKACMEEVTKRGRERER